MGACDNPNGQNQEKIENFEYYFLLETDFPYESG